MRRSKGFLQPRYVLIVPLWNWNTCIWQWHGSSASSNRTFMELKLRILMCTQVHTSSNRTFMELKYDREYEVSSQSSGSNRTFMELQFVNTEILCLLLLLWFFFHHQQRFWQNRAIFLYLTPKLSGMSEKIFKFAFKYNIL